MGNNNNEHVAVWQGCQIEPVEPHCPAPFRAFESDQIHTGHGAGLIHGADQVHRPSPFPLPWHMGSGGHSSQSGTYPVCSVEPGATGTGTMCGTVQPGAYSMAPRPARAGAILHTMPTPAGLHHMQHSPQQLCDCTECGTCSHQSGIPTACKHHKQCRSWNDWSGCHMQHCSQNRLHVWGSLARTPSLAVLGSMLHTSGWIVPHMVPILATPGSVPLSVWVSVLLEQPADPIC